MSNLNTPIFRAIAYCAEIGCISGDAAASFRKSNVRRHDIAKAAIEALKSRVSLLATKPEAETAKETLETYLHE